MNLTQLMISTWNAVTRRCLAHSLRFSIGNDGAVFYFLTNKDAPQYKLVSVDISEPAEGRKFKDVIPEDKDAQLEDVAVVNNDKLVVVYKRNVSHLRSKSEVNSHVVRLMKVKDELYIYSMQGVRLTRLAEDFVGSMSVVGRREQHWLFVNLTSFTTPGITVRYDFKIPEETKRWSTYRTTLVKGLNPNDFIAKQVGLAVSPYSV